LKNDEKINIRRYDAKDKEAVLTLINQIMSAEFSEDLAAYPTDDVANIETAYGKVGDAFFIAENGGHIVGTVAIKKEDPRVALLRRLFVDPNYRHRQIGLKLMERAIQFCQEVGYQELIFKTTSRMRGAIQLCQKRGFVQRAKLSLGPIELFKFSLSLRDLQNA